MRTAARLEREVPGLGTHREGSDTIPGGLRGISAFLAAKAVWAHTCPGPPLTAWSLTMSP